MDYSALQKILKYNFKNLDLLTRAFTHSSYAYKNKAKSNERLEFLGDSVLNLITTKYLIDNFNYAEGVLSKVRAYLVSSEYVSKPIKEKKIYKYLLVANGLDAEKSENVLGDLFEAIVGAIFEDSKNLKECENFIFENLKFSEVLVENIIFDNSDYKSALQEFLQSSGEKPKYELVNKTGPAHKLEFVVACKINNEVLAECVSHSIKSAENMCAKIVLEKLKHNS